ncbi:unnamed protein product [Bursaphelenchus xylophilus]|uniref:(pine wood nematode) hypothetical protein n=1 Tax=Bursaphelenchus xylophilus TaxID=6326 RepID=A0A1I7SSV3_BURXY|nr:unnamed protein product [Bursaphelenchus xylophilus]CAG9108869.1 unnamed protein product [Bursaphelenchus xylophilus]
MGMEDEADLENFILSFQYYFRHFYGPTYPRDMITHHLLDTMKSLFHQAKRLVDAKKQHPSKKNVSVWETCQELATKTESITTVRPNMTKVLKSPLVQNLLLAYDEITNYAEDLPPAQETSTENDLLIKIVNIVKGEYPLGATIKVYANGDICIARVMAGGAADRCGSIQPGDQILEINNIPVSFKSPEEVLEILNSTPDGVVTFKLVPGKDNSKAKVGKSKRYVRALFDYMGYVDQYQPCKEAALNFQNGDILEVYVTGDPFWQQARIIGHGSLITAPIYEDDTTTTSEASTSTFDASKKLEVGLIPTEMVLMKGRNYTFEPISQRFYEFVDVLEPGEIRPVILIGAPCVGRNSIKSRLIASNPLKYAAPVPHTSRPPRPNERHGVDYYFASRSQMETWIAAGHFVEYGELHNNLYGTMDQAVFQLMRQGKVPVICAHPLSLRILRSALFKPVIVFVEPPHFSLLKQMRMKARAKSSFSGNYLTEQDFAHIISYSAQMSAEYSKLTDFRVVNGVLEEAVAEIIRILRDFETLPSWVPEDWILSKGFKNSCC